MLGIAAQDPDALEATDPPAVSGRDAVGVGQVVFPGALPQVIPEGILP